MSALSPDHIAAFVALAELDGPWDGSRHDYYHAQMCSVMRSMFDPKPPPPREFVIPWDQGQQSQTQMVSFDTACRIIQATRTK